MERYERRMDPLTDIQKLILTLNRKGFKQSEIAEKTNRSQQCVSAHIKAIEKKGWGTNKMYLRKVLTPEEKMILEEWD